MKWKSKILHKYLRIKIKIVRLPHSAYGVGGRRTCVHSILLTAQSVNIPIHCFSSLRDFLYSWKVYIFVYPSLFYCMAQMCNHLQCICKLFWHLVKIWMHVFVGLPQLIVYGLYIYLILDVFHCDICIVICCTWQFSEIKIQLIVLWLT